MNRVFGFEELISDAMVGEDITQILVRTDGKYILRLQFITSHGTS